MPSPRPNQPPTIGHPRSATVGYRSPLAAACAATLAACATVALAAAAATPSSACEKVEGNLVVNCGFTTGIDGWRAQAASTVGWEPRLGNRAPGALRMVNEPASEAGAVTCVAVAAGGRYELLGFARRLAGPGECLAHLSEHVTADCSGGATQFHEMVSTPLARNTFTRIGGSATVATDTASVGAGFACYGEHDDDVGGVLLDDVVLRRVPAAD
jgi:hypothetical protein